MDNVDDSLVEQLWRELNGQVSRQQIVGAVTEIAAGFEKATVRGFVPIFVHRRALEQLRGTLASPGPMADSSTPAAGE